MQIHSFIDNAFYQSESKFIKSNPYTLEKLHQVSSCDLMGLIAAIQSSNKAFQLWKHSSYVDRLNLIEKIQTLISTKQDEYARLEALNQGLPISFVKKNSIKLLLKNIEEIKNQKPPAGHMQYTPVGVLVIVASWNLSLRVIFDRLIPALFAGNSVVIKVSSESPVTAHILAEILLAVDAPKGLVNIIATNDKEVKKTLICHPGVKAISLTGSLETTTEILPLIAQTSLQSFKKIQISSGSKNSTVVLEEPSNESFVPIINSFLAGQGQLVWNSARLFILEKYEQQWEEKIKTYLEFLRPSEGIEDDSLWTPCIKQSSFAKFEEIKHMAYEDKAKLLQSGFTLTDLQKKVFIPAIFTKDMSRCSTLQQDQIHSPVYILSTVKYPFDVPRYSNVSYFGFAAHLWGDAEKLTKIAGDLDVGLVTYNKSSVEVYGAFGAVKQSGYGLQNFQSFGSFFSNVKKIT